MFINSYCNKNYNTTRNQEISPRIDGMINEEAWNQVQWEGEFIQTMPKEKISPSQQTQFKIIYDEEFIYVAIRCFDSSPDSIDTRLSRRDGFDGDWVAISFDSYHDKRTAFTFTVNAAGVKSDGASSNDGNGFDDNWDPIWDVKTSIDNLGWCAEMKIPFTQLRFANNKKYTWGLQLWRRLYRKNEESLWKFKSPKDAGWVSHYGELTGIENIRPKKQKDITPYTVGKSKTYKKDAENPFTPGKEYIGTLGVDGKIGLSNDLTMDFTINPDFGQVEADPSEMNLTTFETYQRERRPFFIEGKSILEYWVTPGWWELSNDNAFYSRRIGRRPFLSPDIGDDEYMKSPDNTTILGAFKVTGKTSKGWSVAMMESITQKEEAEIDHNGERRYEEMEPATNYFVSRVQKDMNDANTRLGAFVSTTNRKIESGRINDLLVKNAYTVGIDFNHEWKDKKYYLLFNTLFSSLNGSKNSISETQINAPHFLQRTGANHLSFDSTRNNLSGIAGTLRFGSNGNGSWMYSTWITLRTPGFNINQAGFMRTADIFQQTNWVGYRMQEEKGIFRFISLNFNQWNAWTLGGERLYTNGNFNAHFNFTNFWNTGGGFSLRSKSLLTHELRGGPALLVDRALDYFFYFSTNDKKKIEMYLETNGERFENDLYKRFGIYTGLNFRFIEQMDFSLGTGYMKSYNYLQYVNNIDYKEDKRYIRGYMDQHETSLTFRLNLYLSPDFTIQYYGMPFISAGKYNKFKYILSSQAGKLTQRYQNYSSDQIEYDESEQIYSIDENRDNVTDYTFDDPDFNMKDFNSNLVLRWEYRPGSLLYLVWSQNRNQYTNNGDFRLGQDVEDLFSVFPNNVFLVKISFRIGL